MTSATFLRSMATDADACLAAVPRAAPSVTHTLEQGAGGLWPKTVAVTLSNRFREVRMNERAKATKTDASAFSVPLDRDIFLRTLIRELSGALEDVVGLDEAAGYISVVGAAMGGQINSDYKSAFKVSSLSRKQVGEVLVDLKRRIRGDFFIIEETDEKIVLGNRACPFAEKVIGRKSMCMMTSNVFGHIAAENLGYGKVELQKTIADGHRECLVVVYLKPTEEAERAEGREYVRSSKT
jgi:hypothetical protein